MRNALAVRPFLPNKARKVGLSPWARCASARETSRGRRMAGCLLGNVSSDLGPGSDALAEGTSWHGPSAKCREIGKARNHPQLVKLTSCRGASARWETPSSLQSRSACRNSGSSPRSAPSAVAAHIAARKTRLPIHLHNDDLPCRYQSPQQFVEGLGRDADYPTEIVTRYAAGFGNSQRDCRRVGDFLDAMLQPFRERDSPHGICMLSGIAYAITVEACRDVRAYLPPMRRTPPRGLPSNADRPVPGVGGAERSRALGAVAIPIRYHEIPRNVELSAVGKWLLACSLPIFKWRWTLNCPGKVVVSSR